MKDQIGKRMKEYYETRFRSYIPRRTNVIIRIDGKAFHSYCRGLDKPFDYQLIDDMIETTKFLCENIQGCKLGYCQSDEISLLITDYDKISTSAWFDYNVQKMTSISASIATAKFNELRPGKLAMFDSRVFCIADPQEVVNYFLWRQIDATRNSISMAAQSMFSHRELHKVNTSQMQDKMMLERGVNWNDYPVNAKRGAAIVKCEYLKDGAERSKWDSVETPIFSKNRNFILDLLPKIEV